MQYESVTVLSKEYSLSLLVFTAKEAKGTMQIVHGMEEHKERYIKFAEFLQANGYNVVVSDLRGHGKDAPELSHIEGVTGQGKLLLEDQKEIRKYIQNRFPNVPLILFGHSMGSIISRVILQSDSKEYSKVVLSGYVNPNGASGVAYALATIISVFKSPRGHSKLMDNLAVGQFGKAIKDRKTELDWLSYNEENVQKYIDDPYCGVPFSLGSYKALFSLLKNMGKAKKYKDINEDLPFLFVSGKDDPCAGGDKGREQSQSVLKKAGFKNLSVITYEGMRHEILNELDYQKVYDDILKFLN